MVTRTIATTMLILVLTAIGSGPAAVAAPEMSGPRLQVEGELSVPAAFAIDLTSGVVLYEVQADMALPPASTSKLLTALTAMRVLSVNEQVTIQESDLVPEEFSKMGVEPGDIVTVEQLLYGALVPSGGDAARALARESGIRLDPASSDPIERFVQEMNAVAVTIDMQNSSFGNPVGEDDDRSWTTARDLARASSEVLNDPLLSRIVATPWASTTVAGPNERELVLENSNLFVLFDGAIGVKTGTTDAAGQNLVNAFKYGDHTILSIVLGSQDRYADTTLLLQLIAEQRDWISVGGTSPSLGATDELSSLGLWMPVGTTIMVDTTSIERIRYAVNLVEGRPGGPRGTVEFTLDDETIAALPVYELGQPAGEGP